MIKWHLAAEKLTQTHTSVKVHSELEDESKEDFCK